MHTETIEATDWWARPRGATAANWIANYQRSLQARHRDVIVSLVQSLGAETLLEVGCHCGPNLMRLATEMPTLRMIGIDANDEAVQAGRGWMASKGCASRVQLNTGRFPAATSGIADGSFDIVLSCYALAYVAPADLEAALYEMGRLATMAIILAEPQTDAAPTLNSARSLSGYTEWAHRYREALKWIGSLHGATVRTVPIEPPVDKLNAVLVAVKAPRGA
jgi:ubiquinone/menaquinone biosynthesis C-methylase UbiE